MPGLLPERIGKFIKKSKHLSEELRKEYSKSDFKKLERGKYYKDVVTRSNVVILDPAVASIFPNSASVNEALHGLVDVVKKPSQHPIKRTKRNKIT